MSYICFMKSPVLLILFLILTACSFQERLTPNRWECVNSNVDSATNCLESMFIGNPQRDSIVPLLKILDDYSKSIDDEGRRNMMKSRICFWKGRIAEREHYNDSAVIYYERGLSHADSSRYPYTFWKLKFERAKCLHTSNTPDIYMIQKAYDYFKKVDDKPMQAAINVTVGNILNFARQSRLAIDYFHAADSIYGILGYQDYIIKNKLNLASALSQAGMPDSSYRILNEMRKDPVVLRDFSTHNTVLRNLYAETGDTAALLEAYDMVRERPDYADVRTLYEALLSGLYLSRNNTDSADLYSRRAFAGMNNVVIPAHKSFIWEMESYRHERIGEYDSALYCRNMMELMRDSAERISSRDEVGYAQYYYDMSRIRNEKERDREKYLLLISTITILVIVSGGTVWFTFTRSRQRLRLQVAQERTRLVESELERERDSRRMMALSLAKQETEKIMEDVKDAVDMLYKNGKIERADAASLRSTLCDYALQSSDWSNFEELFKSSNPHFVPRLLEICPGLTPMQIKLASLTLIGMSIKQIASYLNVKSESVMQARWRLRNKLSLKTDESLEAALHRLNESTGK